MLAGESDLGVGQSVDWEPLVLVCVSVRSVPGPGHTSAGTGPD